MICEECSKGNHEKCSGEGCDCDSKIDSMVERAMATASRGDVIHSRLIYDQLMSKHRGLAQMFTDGAGEQAVQAFIFEVLQTRKALVN